MRAIPASAFLITLIMACSNGAAVSSSDSGPAHVCSASLVAGIAVSARDSATGKELPNVVVTFHRNGVRIDSLQRINGEPAFELAGAFEQAGTFDVAVSSPGYRPWTSQNVEVRRGTCHVETVHLVAVLRPTR